MIEKEYECVEVKQYNDVGKTITRYQKNGWHLHTYQAAGLSGGLITSFVNHYLLFEKDK